MADMIALAHAFFLKVGVLGFAGLWVLKAMLGLVALRWLRAWRQRTPN
ncbi:hypothetical protein Q4577_21075 [Marinovum sp. 2_MG-2023]|nr:MULTISPECIES: hypothetical protein [Roseobacteraceae]MCJ7872431.1 hypothetical protein [Phaeobacter sp. J2-8]MDO6732526.1 hypothetical protein [Marinovum sp. 2_MG-2023]MDO6780492.1 hypothetical protein [Marinovum sp. 1_MG-2023]